MHVRTNPAGAISNSFSNLPFGDCLTELSGAPCNGSVGSTPAHFTDQDRDDESGLDHFLFRQYSSVQGRWMSPDPAGLAAVDPSNPQTWNRYAYVAGNPVNAADPDGRMMNLACPAGWCGGGGGGEPSCLSCGAGLSAQYGAYGPGYDALGNYEGPTSDIIAQGLNRYDTLVKTGCDTYSGTCGGSVTATYSNGVTVTVGGLSNSELDPIDQAMSQSVVRITPDPNTQQMVEGNDFTEFQVILDF